MRDAHNPDSAAPAVVRRVGGFTAGCLLVSNIVGSGIFTTTGFMARDLGDPSLILSLWLAGALLALAGAICYGELGAALPQAGGEYLYLREAYGPLTGFLSGWASFTVGFGAAIAAAAVSFSAYALRLFEPGRGAAIPETLLALSLVWVLTAFHLVSVGAGGAVQRLLTVLKVSALLLLIAGGLASGQGSWENLSRPAPEVSPTPGSLVVPLIFVMYAYSGWNVAGYIAGEIVNPGRTIPRTMIRGTLFVGFLYLALNVTYLYALPVSALAQAPVLPVAEKASVALFGPAAARLVAVMLCLSIAGSVSAMIWAGPRVYYSMARDGLLPSFFSRVQGASGVPRNAILLQSAWATILILTGTFEQLVIFNGLTLTAFSTLAVGAVIILRRRRPRLARPYLVPLYPLLPCAYIALAAMMIVSTAVERPTEAGLAAATVLAGGLLYGLMGSSRRRLTPAPQAHPGSSEEGPRT